MTAAGTPVRRRRARETWRHRRRWYPARPPYGYEDLPGRAAGRECVETGVFEPTATPMVAARAVTWDERHPRDAAAIAVLRDPASMPWELGWGPALDLHSEYALSNALLLSHPTAAACSHCDEPTPPAPTPFTKPKRKARR